MPATLQGGRKDSWSQAAQSQRSSWSLWPGDCCSCFLGSWAVASPHFSRPAGPPGSMAGAQSGLLYASCKPYWRILFAALPSLSPGCPSLRAQFIFFFQPHLPGPEMLSVSPTWSISDLDLSLCGCWVSQSCPAQCDPTDCSPPGSSVHGILQARILEWVAIPFSSCHLPSWPRDQTQVSCIACRFFIVWATWEAMKENFQTKMTQMSGCNLKKTSQFWDRLMCSRSVVLWGPQWCTESPLA